MSTKQQHPWRRDFLTVPTAPRTETGDRHRASRKIMNDSSQRDQAGRKHENALAGRVGNGGRHT